MTDLDAFTAAYITAALWSSTDDNDTPLDTNYSAEDIAPDTLEKMKADCAAFQLEHGAVLTEEHCTYRGCPAVEYAGHDFWLNRCGHGCGFWDGDWLEPVASVLDSAAQKFGNVDLYIGDDGMVHAC